MVEAIQAQQDPEMMEPDAYDEPADDKADILTDAKALSFSVRDP